MVRSITVFIRTKWIVKPFSSSSSAWLYGGYPPEDRIEKELSKEDESALKVVKELAREFGFKVDVRDLGKPNGWVSGVINRVKITPTVIINSCRIEGAFSRDDLVRLMKNNEIVGAI